MAGALERASHGDSAVRYVRIKKSEGREKKGEGSAWLARLGAPRTAILPCDTKVGIAEGRKKKVVRGHYAVGYS